MYVLQSSFGYLPEFLKLDQNDRLVLVLDALNAEPLLAALGRERKGRRDDYPVRVMWYTLIAGIVHGKDTIRGLIDLLRISPDLRRLCGIQSSGGIPSESAYSRFFGKLVKHQEKLQAVFDELVEQLRELAGEMGETLAIDSTDIHAWSTPYGKKTGDQDARWGQKTSKRQDGQKEVYRWLGYKLHLLVCAITELPVGFRLTPANRNDGPELRELVKEAKDRHKEITKRCRYVVGDAAYDNKENYRLIVEELKATPIIPLNLRGEKEPPGICNHQGTPLCSAGYPMSYAGHDNGFLKYRAPCVVGKEKKECPLRAPCCDRRGYGLVVKLRIKEDYRRFTAVPRETKKWKRLYKRRTAVERVNSRLKSHFLIDDLRVQGIAKVQVRVTLGLLVMLAGALAMARRSRLDQMRRLRACA